MSDFKLDRRGMLKLLSLSCAASFSPINNPLYALSTRTPKNYVSFQILGGPSRWTWEPLNPFDNDSLVTSNENVVNFFSDSGSGMNDQLSYRSVSKNGINMPWLWGCDIPTSSGGTKQASDLMDNMLMIRGVNVVNPDHRGARSLQFYPGGMSNTITSLTGDQSDKPIPFIGMNTSPNPYKSDLKKSGVRLNTRNNWIKNLVQPFLTDAASFEAKLNQVSGGSEGLMDSVERFLVDIFSGYSSSRSSRKGALELIKRDFGNLDTEFYGRRDKYRSLLRKSTLGVPDDGEIITNFAGVNDKPIMINGIDIRDTLKEKQGAHYIHRMAEQFAVIEYSLIHGLSTSLAAALTGFSGFSFDEHTVDKKQATLVNNLWNRGFLTCLNELKSQLIANNLWNDTIIQIYGEFGRTPKGTEEGSDHAPGATCVTYFGGSIAGNEILGNTKIESGYTRYPGTWGQQALNDTFGYIGSGHIAATTAYMLNVDNPVTSSTSLVKTENGKIVGKLGRSKLK